MRNISFMLTRDQVLARTKDVTRRLGWRNVRVGEDLRGCEKCQGLRRGEHVVQLALIRVVAVRFEPLRRMTDDLEYGFEEVRREGFADHPTLRWPSVWVDWFCSSHRGCTLDTEVTRIEFTYL